MTDPSLSIELLAAVDAACDRFEQAWRDLPPGREGPACEDFLQDLPDAAKPGALGELFAIERQYRASRGQAASAWTTGRPAIEALASASRDEAETLPGPGLPNRPSPNSGLQLCCPQCQQHVELLEDVALDQITCKACGSSFDLTSPPDAASAPPAQIGRFLLREQLGVGGFGVVWRARDPQLDRDVALKAPRRHELSPHEAELFFREARAAAQLTHPGIVSVHEVGRDQTPAGGSIYIVSELVDGEPLSERLKTGRVTRTQAAALVADIADALEYAHGRGVIHRDLKPSNIMLDRFAPGGEIAKHAAADFGRPRLMDFGLAKRDTGEATMTIDGQVLGTPAYMSPEQASGQVRWVDRRTDIYALGVVLFRLLTGELPFRGTASSQIQQRITDDAPGPRQLDDTVPIDLANVCVKCLQREPSGRYATAEEVAAEMRRYLSGEPVLARPLSWWGRAGRWARRRPAAAAVIGLSAALAIIGPTSAIVIDRQNELLESRLRDNQELVRRQEEKIDDLTATIQDLPTRDALPFDRGVSERRAKLIDRLLAKHGEKLLAVAQASDPNTSLGREARLAVSRLLIAGGRADEAMTLLGEAAPSGTATSSDLRDKLRSLLNQVEIDRKNRLDKPVSESRVEAETRLRETGERQQRLDQFFSTTELGPQEMSALVEALLGRDEAQDADE